MKEGGEEAKASDFMIKFFKEIEKAKGKGKERKSATKVEDSNV